MVWRLEDAARPYDAYMELHFTNPNTGVVLSSQSVFDNYNFVREGDRVIFFNDTLDIRILNESEVVLGNDYFYGRYSIDEIRDYDTSNIDSMFNVNNALYLLKNSDPETDSLFIFSVSRELIYLLQGMSPDEYEVNVEEDIE